MAQISLQFVKPSKACDLDINSDDSNITKYSQDRIISCGSRDLGVRNTSIYK
jgi:hypothetical protein